MIMELERVLKNMNLNHTRPSINFPFKRKSCCESRLIA